MSGLIRLRRYAAPAVAAGLLTVGGGAVPALADISDAADTYSYSNGIPPRRQWNANFGYCGEVSVISIGLYFGQYISQYEARALASNHISQALVNSQLLINVNDTHAAKKMHLDAVEWDNNTETSTNDFLAWVKGYVLAGDPVAIGLFTNEYLFSGITNPKAGSRWYDHIVPVTGIASNHPLTLPATYYGDDVITFSDNGVWTGNSGLPTYMFSYTFDAFQATREQANSPSGTIYSVPSDAVSFGMAITGVIDEDKETVPVRVATNINYENPVIVNNSNTRPAPEPLVLTVTVSGLTPGVAYNLYRYDKIASVPNSAFNANASKAYQKWNIQISSGSTYVMTQNIFSDQVAAYRAVPASAP